MTVLRIVAVLIAAILAFLGTVLATTFEASPDTAALLVLVSIIAPVFVGMFVYRRLLAAAGSKQEQIETTAAPEEPTRHSTLTVAPTVPVTSEAAGISTYDADRVVMTGESSDLLPDPATNSPRQAIPNVKQFFIGAIVIGLCTYLAGSFLHSMPPWAVATCTFSMAVMIMLPRLYVRTLRRMHENQLFRKEGIVYRFRTKRLILTATWFLLSICISFYTLLQLNIMDTWEWAVFFFSFPVLYFVYIACYRFLSIHVEPLHICRISLSWAAALSPIFLVCLFALATWNVDQSASAETLTKSVAAKRHHLATSNGSALVDESLQIISVMAGARAYLGGQIGAISATLSKSIAVFNSLLLGYFSASLLSCLLIPRIEYRRLFGQLPTNPIPKPIKPAKIAAWSAISVFVFGFIYLHGYVALEAEVSHNPQWREERVRIEKAIFAQVDEIAGQYYNPGTVRQIQEARAQSIRSGDVAISGLEDQIDKAFVALEGNVDLFLDWYYSLPAEYARLGYALTGDVEENLAKQMTEHLNRGSPFASVSNKMNEVISVNKEASALYEAQKVKILAINRITSPDGQVKVVDTLSKAELDIPPTHPTISDMEARMAGAGAVGVASGMITGKVVGKVVGKTAFKLAAKGMAKIAITKAGTPTALGLLFAAIGSVVPGIGTIAGGAVGVVVGLASGVAIDYGLINLEEAISRESFKSELLSAINSAKTEYKGSMFNSPVSSVAKAGAESSSSVAYFPVSETNPMLLTISDAIVESGLPAEIVEIEDADFWVISKSDDYPFAAFLDECDQAGACNWIIFVSRFSDLSITNEQVNSWSSDVSAFDAFIDDDGSVILEMDIQIISGSMSKSELVRHIAIWRGAAIRFEERLVEWNSSN